MMNIHDLNNVHHFAADVAVLTSDLTILVLKTVNLTSQLISIAMHNIP